MWGYISDTLADLCNTLLQCKEWDHSSLFDPISKSVLPPNPLDENIPYHKSKNLAIELPQNNTGKVDIYIDDTIAITPDLPGNTERMIVAVPLVIRTLAHPIDPNDEIPRNDIISIKKFQAEARLEETKMVLGWILNTRSLQISLPLDKYQKWTADINIMISNPRVCVKQLESTLGRLNHVANIISILRHFLGRLRHAFLRASKYKWTTLKLSKKSDLFLILAFMDEAKKGISMNNLVFRKPTMVLRSDASEFGIGGYNLTTGKAWRYKLPVSLRL
jgi:hypothetical protein